MNRVRVFIDFWNFHLSVKAMTRLPVRIDWRQFGLRSAQALGQLPTLSLGGEMRCEGVHIYGSYSPSVKWETKLAKGMNEEVSLLPGLFPLFEKREKASSTRTCKECGNKVRLEPETGIDVRLAVDMIKLSNSEPDTIIILATNDADFIPLAEYLSGLGRRIVHLRTDKGNNKLSQCCWANMALEKLDRTAFPFEDKAMLLMVGAATPFQAEMEDTLKKHAIEYDLCDLSRPSEMELFRIFADNQDYTNIFDFEHIHDASDRDMRGIDQAIAVALKWPDALKGPFLLYRGRVLNHQKMKEQL